MKNGIRLSALALAAALAAAPAAAKEYKMTIGSSHPPVLPWTIPLHTLIVPESNKRLKAAGSPDTIKWTEAYAGALYDFNNTLEGVGDGLSHSEPTQPMSARPSPTPSSVLLKS